MTRQLPPQPDLNHLKQQAKSRLRALRAHNPEAKLADALHAVAREYGFATWPQLKEHVAAIAVREPLAAFAGRWIADIARSKRHPANMFQSASMTFASAGDALRISHHLVDEAGREERAEDTLVVDGQERRTYGDHYSFAATRRGPRVIETVVRRDGQIIEVGTYEVSKDHSTLTCTGPEQVVVLARERRRDS